MKDTIITPGKLTSNEQQTVYLQSELGGIEKINVRVGDKVEEGTTLVQYENSALIGEQHQAKLSLDRSKIQFSILHEQLEEVKKQSKEGMEQSGELKGQSGEVTAT
ncbi:efflux RND transporter periplasmic adaptor subunit [Mechercharimyces sp. CAU 1602]|uniref:efflux RND transporter periplasmic adaptor subunit n=1 Tax=Mechercharimyces sp. CAU 1602 TaxID=2973933 RepID=UPI002162BA43|nr:efflux RND transporter periplasmic adaptor subunit [Mechercharimyces sp. CAU 1602]MCS1350499.1 efflux RND transporter periplasmic adaptor subunit [Mechercharimyces sp. CAU 1602]